MSVKWKPKMKLACHYCVKVSKMVVDKVRNSNDDMDYYVKCKVCGEKYCVTEDLLLEMQEGAQ